MEEITKQEFWILENNLLEIEKTTGELEVVKNGEGRLYKRGFKKWFRSIPEKNIYLADPSLILTFLRKG
jgi:hypothetical protein